MNNDYPLSYFAIESVARMNRVNQKDRMMEIIKEARQRARPWVVETTQTYELKLHTNWSYMNFMPFEMTVFPADDNISASFNFYPFFFKSININELTKDVTDKRLTDLYFEPICYQLYCRENKYSVNIFFLNQGKTKYTKNDQIKIINNIMSNDTGISFLYRNGLRIFIELLRQTVTANKLLGTEKERKKFLGDLGTTENIFFFVNKKPTRIDKLSLQYTVVVNELLKKNTKNSVVKTVEHF